MMRKWIQRTVPGRASTHAPVATLGHFIGFALIGAGVAALGFMAQHAPAANASDPAELAPHGQAVKVYLTAICMDWALLYYCWTGVRQRGGTFETLCGGRWGSPRDLLTDLAAAIPFWILLQFAGLFLTSVLGPNSARTVDALLPRSFVEVLLWIAASFTAGICEEIGFRGYVLGQLRAWTGSTAFAVVGQALVFGLFHLYQGWKNVIVISGLGVLFGLLAIWRKNLRANILSHALMDLWEGWLKFLVWA
jgi:membrane protease YdiL (CAAX protease family)